MKAPKGSKSFLDLAKLNSKQTLKNFENKKPPMKLAFDELMQKFKLNIDNPTLDCIDISHHSGSNAKAGIIRFNINGPDKKFYRSYNIPDELAGNDIGSMKYAIKKRIKNKNEIPKFLLVDGGKNQLNAILSIVNHHEIFVLAIEKGSQRKMLTENIYTSNGQEAVQLNTSLFKFLIKARDEAHRFAISANRKAKQRDMQISILDSIYGLGPKTKEKLFNRFKSIDAILDREMEDLVSVKGVSKRIAKDIISLRSK